MQTLSSTMANSDFLKYCKYYKGEKECPKNVDYDTFARFWYAEKEYCSLAPMERKRYEGEFGQNFCKSPKEIHDFVKQWGKPTRGFMAYYIITSLNMCPSGRIDVIFNDGK